MKIAVNETDGLAQRLEMLSTIESADSANTSVVLTREPCRPSAPSKVTPKQSPVTREIDQERRLKFRQIEEDWSALRKLRAQRLEAIAAEVEAKAKAEEAARLRKQKEEERIARQRAEQREKAELERIAAEQKVADERAASEKKEKERQAAAQAAAEREAAEKVKKDKEVAEKQAAEKEAEENQAKAKQEADKRAADEAAAKAKGQAQAQSNVVAAANEYLEHMKVIDYAKTTLNPQVSTNKPLKKECYNIKMDINAKLGQLTPSRKHLIETVGYIKDCLARAQQLGDLGYDWILNQYSKMVVQQAERESGANGASAVPIAMLTTLIWTSHPKLGKFLVARFVKKDPYVIGYQCSIDTEQGRKRMGYRRNDGSWEGEVKYAERISGITSVWAVITQSKINKNAGNEHPYPITHSWVFLARQANLPVETLYNGNFAAVAAWWDVAGNRFLTAYGRQASKLLDLIANTWPSSVAQKDYAASKRLNLLGKDWKQNGEIEAVWKPLGP